MNPYGIFSPSLGIKQDFPSMLLTEAYTPDSQDVYFQYGEVRSLKKRQQQFTQVFQDDVIEFVQFFKDSTSESWAIAMTKRDIAYRDDTNDRFIYLNKIYNSGTISVATNNSGNTFTLDFSLPSGEDLTTELNVGDFIRLSSSASPYTTDDTWYEVLTVDDADSITCTGQLPSGYSVPSGGDSYAIRKTFQGTDTDYWSTITFVDGSQVEKFIATNNGIDNVIIWTGSGQVADLGGADTLNYKCQKLFPYSGRVLMIAPIETGTLKPFDIRWSGIDDETDWGGSGSDAGSMTVDEGGGILTHCAELRGFLVIFKTGAIVHAWSVTDANIFNKKLIEATGCDAPRSIMETGNKIFFWSPSNEFMEYDGINSVAISQPIDPIVKNINPNKQQYIEVTFIEALNQIWWAIPFSTSETLNKVMMLDLDDREAWGFQDIEIKVFGFYQNETTYDWSTVPFSNWDEWAWDSWKHREGLESFPIDIATNLSKGIDKVNSAETDLTAEYTRHIVFETDLGNRQRLFEFKRIMLMQFYVTKQASGSLTIEYKRDDEPDWQSAGTVSLSGDNDQLIVDLPTDIRCKVLKLKVSATNTFILKGIMLWEANRGVGER